MGSGLGYCDSLLKNCFCGSTKLATVTAAKEVLIVTGRRSASATVR
jgi:hypothetical protein